MAIVKQKDNLLTKETTDSDKNYQVDDLIGLVDIPNIYNNNSFLVVDSSEKNIVYQTISFLDLVDSFHSFVDELALSVNNTSTGVELVDISDVMFVSGTSAIFDMLDAPIGWTQDISINDKMLRVVSGSGGGSGGTWDIGSQLGGSHVLTINEIPSHTHTFSRGYTINSGVRHVCKDANWDPNLGMTSGSTGNNQLHRHTPSTNSLWRPEYRDVIICTKD